MGLFGKKTVKEDPVVKWLNTVDTAYETACHTKRAQDLGKYLTRTCMARVAEAIRTGNTAYQGISRYRHVDWEKREKTAAGDVWFKHVTYDQIKMSHGVKAAVGSEAAELWTLTPVDGVIKVSDIRSCPI